LKNWFEHRPVGNISHECLTSMDKCLNAKFETLKANLGKVKLETKLIVQI